MALVWEGIWLSSFLLAFADFCDFSCIFFFPKSFVKLSFTCSLSCPRFLALCVLLTISILCLAPDVLITDILVSLLSEKYYNE